MNHVRVAIVALLLSLLVLPACRSSQPGAFEGNSYPPHTPTALSHGIPDDEQRYQQALALLGKLHATKVDLDVDNEPLKAVLTLLNQRSDQSIIVDWHSLAEAEIEPDLPITLRVQNLSLHDVMELICRQASAKAPFDPIGFDIVNQQVYVTTVRKLKWHTFLRFHPVADLIENPALPYYMLRDRDLAKEVQRFYLLLQDDLRRSREAPEGRGIFFGDEDFDEALTSAERTEWLLSLIEDSVGSPEEWVDLESTLRTFDGVLAVRTSVSNHVQIELLLNRVREVRVQSQAMRLRQATVMVLLLEAEFRRFAEPADLDGAWAMVERAIELAPNDPLVRFYATRLTEDIQARQKRQP